MNLEVGKKVTPKKSYSQQTCEYGEKLNIDENYKIDYWFPFYGSTMVVLNNGSHVLKQQVKLL